MDDLRDAWALSAHSAISSLGDLETGHLRPEKTKILKPPSDFFQPYVLDLYFAPRDDFGWHFTPC